MNRFFRIRSWVIWFDLFVILDRCQGGYRWIVDDTRFIPVALLFLVFHVEHLYRLFRGSWRWRWRWRYRCWQRFVRFLDDNFDDRLRLGRVIIERTLFVKVVALRARQRIVEGISLRILNDWLHLDRVRWRSGSSPRIKCNLLSLTAVFRGLIFGKGGGDEDRHYYNNLERWNLYWNIEIKQDQQWQ